MYINARVLIRVSGHRMVLDQRGLAQEVDLWGESRTRNRSV
jgi:hypothetical protein